MGKKINHYSEIINLLTRLNKAYPTYTFGQHLARATSYEDGLWKISDKELLATLELYESLLELDNQIDNSEYFEEDEDI